MINEHISLCISEAKNNAEELRECYHNVLKDSFVSEYIDFLMLLKKLNIDRLVVYKIILENNFTDVIEQHTEMHTYPFAQRNVQFFFFLY